ncbi:Uncharacterised protein [Collinsella intestinalis]|nr:Uncharacterised protein [Collinsella intestinalis]
MAASRPNEMVCTAYSVHVRVVPPVWERQVISSTSMGAAELVKSGEKSVPETSVTSVRPSVRAKSLPEPTGITPRVGRLPSSMRMRPQATSCTTPSPPSAMTVSYSAAPAAISVAWRGRSVCAMSKASRWQYMVRNRLRRSAAPAAAPLCAAGFTTISTRPRASMRFTFTRPSAPRVRGDGARGHLRR